MKASVFKLLGVIICSQIFFGSCSEDEGEEQGLEELTYRCSGEEPSKSVKADTTKTFKLILPDSCGDFNTNIPIKIIGDEALLMTLNNEIVRFNPSQWKHSDEIRGELLYRLPPQYCRGLFDYYIYNNQIWIITQKDKNFILAYDMQSKTLDTLLSGVRYTWNSFPFFGTAVQEYNSNKFYLPFVRPLKTGRTALFASFKLQNNKLKYEGQYGILEEKLNGWTPFSNTPIYSGYIGEGYWMCSTSSQGVVHYQIKSGKLIQGTSICFPASSVRKFPSKYPYKKLVDQNFVASTFITDSYNLRILANSKFVLKFVKKKHPFINEETQMKYMMNDAAWFIDSYSLNSGRIQRIEFDSGTHYYTSAFLKKDGMFIARQNNKAGVMEFNKIRL